MTRRRKLAFAAAAVVLSVGIVTSALLVADLYAHSRFERAAGLNRAGYRGRLLGQKQASEHRIAVLGGSTAFGYSVTPEQALPAYLEQKLAQRRRAADQGPVSVANLAYNNEGAFAGRFTLADYSYLEPDVALFHTGYNDLEGVNRRVFRHESQVFRLTGYMPILPVVIREKVMLLRYGSMEAAYRGEKTVFRPTIVQRTTAGALGAVDQIGQSLERQLGRVSGPTPAQGVTDVVVREHALSCAEPWGVFCQTVADSIDYALGRGMCVLVVGQPYLARPQLREQHQEQQRQMAAMVQARYGSNPAVRFVGLGDAIDLSDQALAFDLMHLTPAGNEQLASVLVDPLMDILTELARGQTGERP